MGTRRVWRVRSGRVRRVRGDGDGGGGGGGVSDEMWGGDET